MRPHGAQSAECFPLPSPDRNYAIRPVSIHSAKGGSVRAARRERGVDVGTAARALKMPVTNLISIELGSAEFVLASDYQRARNLIANIRTRGTP